MSDVLTTDGIRLGAVATDKRDALLQCGALLVGLGAATQEYADALFDRELQVSTFLGEGVAIPHGTNESRVHIRRTALGFIQFPDGVDWDGQNVSFVVGIAGKGDEHLEILSQIALIFSEDDDVARLKAAATPEELLALLSSVNG